MRNIFSIIALSASITVMSSCSQSAQNENNTTDEGQQPVGNVQIANPWTDHASLEEAAQSAGRSMNVPESLAFDKKVVYRSIKGKMLEIIIGEDENELRLRSSAGKDDNSGVYNSATPKTVKIDVEGLNQDVVFRVNSDGLCESAYWLVGDEVQSLSTRKLVPESVMYMLVVNVLSAQ